MLLQQHNTDLFIENNLSNSIIGTCISSGHLNLFITFLQQSIDINLQKLHSTPIKELSNSPQVHSFNPNTMFARRQPIIANKKKDDKNAWKWKYLDPKKIF